MAHLSVSCCVVGGGPAGMMLGFLLARAGVEVAVLEKHADFLRDFRGDTIHPSTLTLMEELGLREDFLALPHQEAETISLRIGGEMVTMADFRRLPGRSRFIALMPQWDFLDFLADQGRRYPGFRLLMNAEATGLVESGGRITGIQATTPEGPLTVEAGLVVAADGRRSVLRDQANLPRKVLGAPMDVLWFRLSRRPDDAEATGGTVAAGRLLVTLNRGDYWQCAYVIAKGGFDALRADSLHRFRERVAALLPFDPARADELTDWDRVKLLTVAVDRLTQWSRPGLLCIGDAAHAMSPIGGVGVNLAVQDAVATANLLAIPLRDGTLTAADVARVQRRRMLPTRLTQRLQLLIQNRIISRVLASTADPRPPFALRLMQRFPMLARFPARLLGLGFRPEHIRSPNAYP